MGFLPYFVRLIHVFSFPASVVRGTQRLLSVKYLFGEANVALDFLLLEDAQTN